MKPVDIRDSAMTIGERGPSVDDWWARSELLARLCDRPSRLQLLQCQPSWRRAPLRIACTAISPSSSLPACSTLFWRSAGIGLPSSTVSTDDSLVMPADGVVDVELVWLDFDRYRDRLTPADLAAFLRDRLASLRSRSEAPILLSESPSTDADAAALNHHLGELAASLSGVRLIPLAAIGRQLGDRTFDRRATRVTGMALSDAACVLAAQTLGLVSLPAAVAPRLKAVVVDSSTTRCTTASSAKMAPTGSNSRRAPRAPTQAGRLARWRYLPRRRLA